MRIRTERLTFHDLEDRDLHAVLSYRERLRKQQPWPGSSGQNAEWLSRVVDDVSANGTRREIRLAVLLTGERKLIGTCRIRYTDTACLEAEVLFDLDPHYRPEGYALEAALEVMRLGFEDLGLRRISSWCISSDVATARMLEGAGMRIENVLPRSRWIQGEWWDTVAYSLLKAEWAAHSAEKATPALSNNGNP